MLRRLGLALETPILGETTEDSAIVLRRVSVHPIETCSDELLVEFERENEPTPEQAKRCGPVLADFSGWLRAQAESRRAAARPAAAKRPPRAAKR